MAKNMENAGRNVFMPSGRVQATVAGPNFTNSCFSTTCCKEIDTEFHKNPTKNSSADTK